MAIVQGRTRAQLRQSIGYNLNAIRTGTAYDAGSQTTLISLTLVGGDDNYNGKWIVVNDASNSSNIETSIISDYTASAYRLTFHLTNAVIILSILLWLTLDAYSVKSTNFLPKNRTSIFFPFASLL